jgi:hypothetical protein
MDGKGRLGCGLSILELFIYLFIGVLGFALRD